MSVFEVTYTKTYVVYVRSKSISKIKKAIKKSQIINNFQETYEFVDVDNVSQVRQEAIQKIYSIEELVRLSDTERLEKTL